MFKPFDLVYTRNASEEWVQSRKFPFPGHTCSQSLCFQSCYVECSYICNLRHFLRKVSSENSRLGSTWEKSNACSWLNVFESKIFQQIFRVLPVLLLKKKMSHKAQTKVSCFDSEWFISVGPFGVYFFPWLTSHSSGLLVRNSAKPRYICHPKPQLEGQAPGDPALVNSLTVTVADL